MSQGEAGVATVRDPRAPTAGPAPPSLGAGLESTCRTPPEPPHERVTCAPLPAPPYRRPPAVPAAPAAATWAPGGLSSPGPWAWTLATRSSVASPRPVLPVLPLASRTDQRPSASVRRWRAPSPRIPARPAAAPQAGFLGLPSPPPGDKRFSSRPPPRACFLRQPRKRYLESSPHQTRYSICLTHPEGQSCTSGFLFGWLVFGFVWFGLRLSLSIYPGAHSVDQAVLILTL